MAYTFFNRIFGNADGYLSIWESTTKSTRWLDKQQRMNFELTDISDWIYSRYNVYFGLGLQKTKPSTGRGTASGVCCIPGLWIEMDVGTEGHAADNYPGSVEEALSLITELPLPSYSVHSGGGMHIYWLFKDPLQVDVENRGWVTDLVSGVQTHIINKGVEKGLKVDNTADLARVLRVPGTYNFKCKPKRVDYIKELSSHNRYDPDLFEQWIDIQASVPKKIMPDINEKFPRGERNNSLFTLGSSRRAKGCKDFEIRAILDAANQEKCDPPLPKSELDTIVKSVLKYEVGTTVVIDDFDEVEEEQQLEQSVNCEQMPDSMQVQVVTPAKQKVKKKKTIHMVSCALTDLGNAKRFVTLNQNKCLYNNDAESWFIWTGKKWEIDRTYAIQKLAERVIELLKAETAAIKDPEVQEAYAKWLNASQSIGHLDAIHKMSKSYMPISNDKFDTQDMLINCTTGIVNLKNGELLEHHPNYFMSKMVNAKYDPGAECPTFINFLDSVFEKNQAIIEFLQRWFGYNLTGRINEKKYCIMTGALNNGKSTLLNTLKKIMGDYGHTCDISTLLSIKDRSGSESSPDIAALNGARYVITSEGKEGQVINDSLVKKLIGGGDEISARQIYQYQFTFVPKLKLSMMTNHVPKIDASDRAMWQRVIFIPFNKIFEGAEIDYEMPEKLLAEADGIFAWLVKGCLEWQRNGLRVPDVLLQATNALRSACDPVDQWIIDNCVKESDAEVNRKFLWDDFTEWAYETKNDDAKKITQKKFVSMMFLKGFRNDKISHGNMRFYSGIRLAN